MRLLAALALVLAASVFVVLATALFEDPRATSLREMVLEEQRLLQAAPLGDFPEGSEFALEAAQEKQRLEAKLETERLREAERVEELHAKAEAKRARATKKLETDRAYQEYVASFPNCEPYVEGAMLNDPCGPPPLSRKEWERRWRTPSTRKTSMDAANPLLGLDLNSEDLNREKESRAKGDARRSLGDPHLVVEPMYLPLLGDHGLPTEKMRGQQVGGTR